ncbi:unnamed protein product, partial [Acanthoscelides obtectus]
MDLGFDEGSPPISASAFYGRKKVRNLDAAADFDASCSNNVDVVIIPPDPDTLIDEEDMDDDNLDITDLPTDVPGTLEVFVQAADDESATKSDSEWDDSDNE